MIRSSSFRTAYVSKYVGRAVSSMELLYKKQRNKWSKKYADTKKVKVCGRKEKMYALVCACLQQKRGTMKG